jgi:hypothetical protein
MAEHLSERASELALVADQAIKAGMKVLAIRPHSKQPDTLLPARLEGRDR